MEITRCMEGAPTAMSAPYFYLSPDFLREDFEDFGDPVEDLHNTVVVVEPVSGSPLEILKRLQVGAVGSGMKFCIFFFRPSPHKKLRILHFSPSPVLHKHPKYRMFQLSPSAHTAISLLL